MLGRIWNVQIHNPGPAGGSGGDYWTRGLGSQLAGLYGELLGMRLIDIGYKKLARDGDPVEIGFEYAPHDPPPSPSCCRSPACSWPCGRVAGGWRSSAPAAWSPPTRWAP
jgi:hypothetical protein